MCCRRRDWLTSAGRPGGKQRAQRDRVISCGCTIDCDAPLDQALADPHVGRAIDRHHAFDHILIEKQCGKLARIHITADDAVWPIIDTPGNLQVAVVLVGPKPAWLAEIGRLAKYS